MNIIGWIIVGGIAGWLASIVLGKNKDMGILANIATGIVGALIGGWLVGLMGGSADVMTGFNLASIATAFFGSVVLLFILGLIGGRK